MSEFRIDQIKSQDALYQTSIQGYRYGKVSNDDLIRAQKEWLASQQTLVDAKAALLTAHYELQHITGSLIDHWKHQIA